MPDAAMSVAASPLAALLSGAPVDSAKPTAQGGDPFAALLAGAADPKNAGVAKPSAAETIVALLASAAPIAPTPGLTVAPVTEKTGKSDDDAGLVLADSDAKSDDDSDDKDALADAIASGATAVLALAPTIVTPVPPTTPTPTPTPITIDAPVEPQFPKLSALLAANPHRRFAPVQPSDPQPQPDQPQLDTRAEPDPTQGDADTPQPPAPQAETLPAAAQLSPEVAKAVVAALQQKTRTVPQAAADPNAAATDVMPTPAQIQPQASTQAQAQAQAQAEAPVAAPPRKVAEQAEQPVVQQAQQQAAPVQQPAAMPRRRSDDVSAAAPRRPGDTRKRSDNGPTDAASAGLTQRAALDTRIAAGQAVGEVQGKGDAMVQKTLDMANESAWLDSLARDIAGAGTGGNLQFKLNPQNLGALTVAIKQSDDGASIRLTADNDKTRDILVDAQPKLIAEARAQGLRVAETHVEVDPKQAQPQDHNPKQDQNQSQSQNQSQHQTANQDNSRWAQGQAGQQNASQNGQNRQSSPEHKPFVSNLGRKTDADSESPDGDSDALYA